VETSTYGSELVASCIAIEMMISLRYILRMLGVKLEKTLLLVGDNMAVISNTTIQSVIITKFVKELQEDSSTLDTFLAQKTWLI